MDQKVQPKEKSMIPWMIVGFFVVLALLDSFFVYTAFTTHTGLRVEQAYEKGLAYNKKLEAYEAQSVNGWKTELKFALNGDEMQIKLIVKDKDNQFLNGAKVDASLVRPTHEGHDQEFVFSEVLKGNYHALVTVPLRGLWEIAYTIKKDGFVHRGAQRIQIPDDE